MTAFPSARLRRILLCLFSGLLIFAAAGCSKPETIIRNTIQKSNTEIEAGKTNEAVARLEKLDKRYPGKPRVMEALGFAYASREEYANAASQYLKALQAAPDMTGLRLRAARALLQSGDKAAAANQFSIYLKQFPDDADSWKILGDLRSDPDIGEPKAAIEAYLSAYHIRPSGEISYRIGTLFLSLNNVAQAKTWFETTVKRRDGFVDKALLSLLTLNVNAGDFSAAETDLKTLDEFYPGLVNQSGRAGLRDRINKWNDSQKQLAKARADQAKLTADLEKSADDQEAAKAKPAKSQPKPKPPVPEVSKKVAKTKPANQPPKTTSSTPAEKSAQSASQAKKPKQTPAAGKAGLPAKVAALAAKAVQFEDQRKWNDAEKTYWQAISKDSKSAELWASLAHVYIQLKRYPEAESCILEARRRAPDSTPYYFTYLNIIQKTHSAQDYISELRDARNKYPNNSSVAFALAQAYATQGNDIRHAIRAYEDYLLLALPGDPDREKAQDFLDHHRR